MIAELHAKGVGLDEREAQLALQVNEGGQISGIGRLIPDEHLISSREKETRRVGADEASASGDDHPHVFSIVGAEGVLRKRYGLRLAR